MPDEGCCGSPVEGLVSAVVVEEESGTVDWGSVKASGFTAFVAPGLVRPWKAKRPNSGSRPVWRRELAGRD